MRHRMDAMTDVNQLFAQAEACFQQGRLDEARRLLDEVRRAAGDHPAALHLRALVEKGAGDPAASERAFRRALELSPRDAQILNNYGNLLNRLGRTQDALFKYDGALAADPGFADARLNRGLLYHELDRIDEALADYGAVLAIDPTNVRAHSAMGAALRGQGRFIQSAAAYEMALRSKPDHARALEGRARVALEIGEADAAAHFRRALTVQPDHAELTLGLVEALEAEGDPEAMILLAAAVARRPNWLRGQERLAEMRSEQSAPGHFAAGYEDALALPNADPALHASHWRALALAGRYREALDAMDRASLPEDRDIGLMRAVFVGEAGDPARALDLLQGLDDDADVTTVRARSYLKLGDFGKAATLFERVVGEQPHDVAAWAHLGLAWRACEDPRHEWLCGQPGLFDTVELALDAAMLDRLATLLRTLHRTRAHPIGQSLRGGTQTRGTLFWRSEPELAALRSAIDAGMAAFLQGLPPGDFGHPLLRHRDTEFELAGSWSVRLTNAGFHVSHIHPQGVLSSACYISLPQDMSAGDHQGWLELGRPPVELGLKLEPLALIEPRPGRLVLFPSYLYHGTRPFASGERLTVAFDVAAN